MTKPRRMMPEELECRNDSAETIRQYLRVVAQFVQHLGKLPDQLSPDDLRSYQACPLREHKLAVGSVAVEIAGPRFF
jgi:hypothetical protein